MTFLNDGPPRCSLDEAFDAGLMALRAAGLEPSHDAKQLAARVVSGEITPWQMEAMLIAKYRGEGRT